MAYGEALEEHASLELTAWADDYAQHELVDHGFKPKEILAAVDKAFPDRRPPLRNAIVFLVLYRGYYGETENQRSLAHLIQQHEADGRALRDQIDRLSRRRRPSVAPTSSTAMRPPDPSLEIKEQESKLSQLTFRLNSRVKQLSDSKRRVNLLLRLINHSYPYVESVPPEIVAEAKPGPRQGS